MPAFDFVQRHASQLLMMPGLCTKASWGGRELSGVRSTLKRSDAATLAGDQVKYDFSLLVPESEIRRLGACPQPFRDAIALEGETHLVIAVDSDTFGNRRIHLGSRYG